ncbi:LysR family transcriptional regulator [Caenimonas soli]|uniref:LysR family transcriptional regulator n=1 Tax=Caenimonas soli TaxID=2735555 RepID=UPI00155185A5|nr:LysR family transcriptional regulator [Caenimonas soli]NPC59109.1 LysR family transcriptional regulator [Caenimonas soli]
MTDKTDQRVRLTLRQLEVFSAIARGGSTRAAAGQVARSQSAASNALSELETTLGVELFDRVGKRLVLNENGRALLPRAASIVEQAIESEALFTDSHLAPLRLASSYTIGEYLLPDLLADWRRTHPKSQIKLSIVNTHQVFESVATFAVDVGFIEGQHTHPDLTVKRWRTDELIVIASPKHPFAKRRPSLRQLADAVWILREPGSGTREASDRWLIPNLQHVNVDLELGSNEAVKRAVASGLGLGCLSRHTVVDAIKQGWLVEVKTSLSEMRRTLSIVMHRSKQLGSVSQDFLQHCMQSSKRLRQ